MKVRDVMSTRLVTAQTNQTASDLSRMMAEQNVGSVLILQNGELRGIVTDRDIVVKCLAQGIDPSQCRADSIMSTGGVGGLVKVNADDDTLDAAKQMGQNKVRRLPVVENNRLVGLISAPDLANEIRKYLDSLVEEEARALHH